MVLINDMLSKNISLEHPSVALSGDARYMARLWVSGKADEIPQSATTSCYPHKKIIAALKQLTFREQHVIVQFWSPAHVVGKHQVLTAMDQPFGLGEITEQLTSYRMESQHNLYVVDNNDHEEEELISPPARVFRRQLPEWTSDVANNYSLKQFPQKESAIRCNLNGYLALPVLDTPTRSCIGVLELLTYSKYPSFAYEVQQFEKALKTQDLTCQKISDVPASNVPFEPGKNELDEILSIMKVVCDTQNIPLAQTWAMSPLNTFSSHEQILWKRCDSFDTKCLGKVCMSTAALPYYVKDLGLWPFWQACRKQHLDKQSHSPVGRALLSGGSCFCGDVTKLSGEEYPLVHFARMHGLTSSFAIHLHSVESNDDYVLEFFLPSHMKDIKHVLNLVQLLKQSFGVAYRFELGDKPFKEVVGPPMDLCVNIEPDIMDTFSDVPDIARTGFVNVPDECSSTSVSTTFTEGGETSSPLKLGRKCKRGSKINMVYVKATYGENSEGFWFPISSGLSKLKKKVAQRFKLKSRMIRLKYLDEDNELILFSSNDDFQFAKIASGGKNRINLICESASYRID